MKKGEIWWANLPPPVGRRPVVLLSRNEAYAVRLAVTVVPLTTNIRHIPVEVLLTKKEGVPQKCVINCDDILTIRKEFLAAKITEVSEEKMFAIHKAIRFALALP